MSAQRTLTPVDDMPTACTHGEATDRRCDICYSTNARQYQINYVPDGVTVTTITPISADASAVHSVTDKRASLLQRVSNLEAADYCLTLDAWLQQVNWQFHIHGKEERAASFCPDKVDWAALWGDHASPLTAYKAVS